MKLFKRIKNGWALTKKSWGILKGNPGLVRFPIIGGLVGLLVAIVVIGPGIFLFASETSQVAGAILAAVGAYLASFAVFYFSVGLAHSVDRHLHDSDISFGEALSHSSTRMSAIAGWALLSVFISTVLQVAQEKLGFAGQILAGLAGAAWGILTFLAIPVIAIEGTGPFATVKRCGSLVKSKWGEQITGVVAIGGIVFFIGILPAILLIVGGIALMAAVSLPLGAFVLTIGVLLLIAAAVVQQAMATIFGVTLYHFAAQGEVLGGFTPEELEGAVQSKGGPAMPGGLGPTSTSVV
jgi:hypothetical protein